MSILVGTRSVQSARLEGGLMHHGILQQVLGGAQAAEWHAEPRDDQSQQYLVNVSETSSPSVDAALPNPAISFGLESISFSSSMSFARAGRRINWCQASPSLGPPVHACLHRTVPVISPVTAQGAAWRLPRQDAACFLSLHPLSSSSCLFHCQRLLASEVHPQVRSDPCTFDVQDLVLQ